MEYSVWRACERLGIKPPDMEDNFEDCDWWTQAKILAYSNIRQQEEAEMSARLASLGRTPLMGGKKKK